MPIPTRFTAGQTYRDADTALAPQAEKLNGRAAMVGYAIAWFVDSLSGWGLVDQQNSFLGKFLLHIAVFAILIFRNLEAIPKYKVSPWVSLPVRRPCPGSALHPFVQLHAMSCLCKAVPLDLHGS